MLNVHIPFLSFFTLYARGRIERKQTVDELGTFIRFNGVVLLYYKYPHHRRAYIVRSCDELSYYPAVTLPNVKQKVGIILRARGRRIDILRNVYWNLEQINGPQVYTWETLFWQKVGCLVDNFNGKKSAAIKSNLIILSREYLQNHPEFPGMDRRALESH
jgi:hypothetical protein